MSVVRSTAIAAVVLWGMIFLQFSYLYSSCKTTGGPEDAYLSAVAGYNEALARQWQHYKLSCQVPTKRCDQWVTELQSVALQAEQAKLKADMLLQGLPLAELQCDEGADPGCTARARLELLLAASDALTLLATQLMQTGGI
jgi:hypothetical protein